MMAPALLAEAGRVLVDVAGVVVVSFFVLLHTAGALLLIRALPELWRHWDLADEVALASVLASEALPTVSVVVTGTADRTGTIHGLRGLLALAYPRHEVVVVHDGAASGQLAGLIEEFDLYRVPPAVLVNVPTGAVAGYYRSRRYGKLFLLDKAHVGRADDLNAALNASRFPYILTVDVATSLEPDALQRLMRPFLLGQRVAAVAGTVRVAGGRWATDRLRGAARAPSAWLPGVQAVESLREAAYGRIGWNRLGQLQTQGTVLLHRRDHLLEMGGYRGGAADPELDLVMRLQAQLRGQGVSDAIPALPDPVAWTSGERSARALGKRRDASFTGQLEALRSHGAALLDARLGATRLLAPIHLLSVALLAPAVELMGYLVLAVTLVTRGADASFVPLFLVAVPGYALLLSLWAVALEAASARRFDSWREVARLCAFAAFEQVGYRQWVMWHRLRAAWRVLFGRHRGERERMQPAPGVDGSLAAGDEAPAR